jgi:FlaG/FlaF family flagellin (archaellin)
MEVSFIIAVALGVAIVVVLLVLIAVIVYQRWRISDNNAHIKAFINENMEMREELKYYKTKLK